MKDIKPIYASVKNANIQAVIAETFRFANVAQALERLQYLGKIFIKSKTQPENVLAIWIEGFDLTAEEIEQGYVGNFAAISFKEVGKKFALAAIKLNAPLKNHPQKKRVKSAHPNWGHPLLRVVKKGKPFARIEEARDLLMKLHEEYPTTTIPLIDKLNIMIYSRGGEGKSPIKKYVLVIRGTEKGFLIETQNKEDQVRKVMPVKEVAAGEPQGKFTQMVQMRRNKKKK